MCGSFLLGLCLVGTTKIYSGVGAGIVMESITPKTRIVGEIANFNTYRVRYNHGDG
jgi:hypothetical protein